MPALDFSQDRLEVVPHRLGALAGIAILISFTVIV